MQIQATLAVAKAPPTAIPTMAPPAKWCVEGIEGRAGLPDFAAADFVGEDVVGFAAAAGFVGEEVVGLGIAVQNPFHESAHSCPYPTGFVSVKALLCESV